MRCSFDVDCWLRLAESGFRQSQCVPWIDATVNVENVACCWLESSINDVGSIDTAHECIVVETKMLKDLRKLLKLFRKAYRDP